MAQESKYNSIQQHEPLRTPSDWSSQGKRFIAQLEEILDDIYRRFNRIRLKDLNPSLQETIVASEEGVASLTVAVDGISGSVDALDGRVTDVEITADGVKTEVQDARGNSSTLKQRVDSIALSVSNAEGDISTLQQTATTLTSKVGTAEGNISTLQQTATNLTSRVTTAEGNVSTLQQTATNLTSRVGTAEGNISSIQQQADSIELTVGKMNVNGTNLLTDGDSPADADGTSNTFINRWTMLETLEVGQYYTLTVCITPGSGISYYNIYTAYVSSDNRTWLGRITPTGTAKQILRLQFTFSGYNAGAGQRWILSCYRAPGSGVGATTLHWAKLEKGTQTSDEYTPPPKGSDNLLYSSNVEVSASDSTTRYFGRWNSDAMVVGEQYTFVACITPGADHGSFTLNTSAGGPAIELGNRITYSVVSGQTTGQKQIVSSTFVFPGYVNDNHQIFGYRAPATVTTSGTVHWAKLYKGTGHEYWSPNPNEINNSGIKITNEGIDIYTGGKLNMSGQTEGSLLLPNGTVNALNGNFTNLSINGQKIGAGSFLMPVLCKFTQGASSTPSGHGFLWFNASGTSYSTASRSGTTDVGYLPRTYTLQAPSNTLTSGTFTYTLTFGVVNRQNSNPNSITFKVTATVGGVTFTSSNITLAKWQTQAVSITVTSTTNLFANTNTLSVAFSSNWSGTSGLGPDLDGSGMTLTAQKSGTSGTQDVTIKYVP